MVSSHRRRCCSDELQGSSDRTCDGVLGEGLHVGQVIVRTVFLQPFADVLLRPQDNRTDQAGLRRARVVYPIIVAGAVLEE